MVGGPKELAPEIPASERTHLALTWDIHSDALKDGVKCGSLINLPGCEHDLPSSVNLSPFKETLRITVIIAFLESNIIGSLCRDAECSILRVDSY